MLSYAEWLKLYPSEWTKRYSKPTSWARITDSNGKTYTVQNYVIPFKHTRYLTYDIDAEQTRRERWSPSWLYPLGVFDVRGDPTHMAYQLGNLAQSGGSCRPTPKEIEQKLVDALDSKRFTRSGRGVVKIFWVVDCFLTRQSINEDSSWVNFASGNIGSFIEGKTPDEFMREQTSFDVFTQDDYQIQKRITQLEEQVEKLTLREKLSKKLGLRK